MTLDVTQLREHVSSDLSDDALTLLLNAAYEAIAEIAGTDGSVNELIEPGPGDLIMLAHPATAISSVKEGVYLPNALASDDYQLRGQILQRLFTGTHPARWWRGRVDVTYTPFADTNERDRVAIALVKLDLNHLPGLSDRQLSQWREGSRGATEYSLERADILASLGQALMI